MTFNHDLFDVIMHCAPDAVLSASAAIVVLLRARWRRTLLHARTRRCLSCTLCAYRRLIRQSTTFICRARVYRTLCGASVMPSSEDIGNHLAAPALQEV